MLPIITKRMFDMVNPMDDLFLKFVSELNLDRNPVIRNHCKAHSFPRNNIKYNALSLQIDLAVPGYTNDKINVSLKDRNLTIKGLSMNQTLTNEDEVEIVREIKQSYFEKVFELKDLNLLLSKLKCTLKNGILSIIIPKKKKLELVELKVEFKIASE